jgi:hypothetical protein
MEITNSLLIAMVSIAWVCLLLPSIIYLNTSWKLRKEKLFARLKSDSIKLYYERFYPNELSKEIIDEDDLRARFQKQFNVVYGKRHYVIPLILLGILSAIGLLGTFFSIGSWLMPGTPAYFSPIVVSAFLGAYAWVLGDQLSRFQNSDFTYHDVYNAVYRFLIAIPLGLSLAKFAQDAVAIPLVFLLAAFPAETLFKFARRLVTQKFGLGEADAENGQLELQQLQGMGINNAERFQKEGITTIAELAWADPIDLMIKTNNDFSFVIDVISQSLLWIYFDKQTTVLYKYSLRGAQEVCSFLDELDSDEPKRKAAAEKTRDDCAALLSITPESFIFTLIAVRDDPYSQLLFNIWG